MKLLSVFFFFLLCCLLACPPQFDQRDGNGHLDTSLQEDIGGGQSLCQSTICPSPYWECVDGNYCVLRSCNRAGDCGAAFTCSNSLCSATCTKDEGCKDGAICVEGEPLGACFPSGLLSHGERCDYSDWNYSEGRGSFCRDAVCIPTQENSEERSCAQSCRHGRLPVSDVLAETEEEEACTDGQACFWSQNFRKFYCANHMAGDELGESCDHSHQCESRWCYEGKCTRICTSRSDACEDSAECRQVDLGTLNLFLCVY